MNYTFIYYFHNLAILHNSILPKLRKRRDEKKIRWVQLKEERTVRILVKSGEKYRYLR